MDADETLLGPAAELPRHLVERARDRRRVVARSVLAPVRHLAVEGVSLSVESLGSALQRACHRLAPLRGGWVHS